MRPRKAASGALPVRETGCLNRLNPRDRSVGSVLGKGNFGSVFVILDDAGRPTNLILKVSNIVLDRNENEEEEDEEAKKKGESEREDAFMREVMFLDKLKNIKPPLVPNLQRWIKCGGQGLQVMERFDSSAKELGQKQASTLLNLDPEKNLAFDASQLRSIINLASRLDRLGIIHGDLKLANLLVKGQKRFVVADFGFAGYRNKKKTQPLMGFTGEWGCPSTEPIPDNLIKYWNRIQLFINMNARALHQLQRKPKLKHRRLTVEQIAKLFKLPIALLPHIRHFCPVTKEFIFYK